MHVEYKEFHVMYVVADTLVHSLKNDFIEAGAKNIEGKFPNSLYVPAQLLQKKLETQKNCLGATIYFYTDVYDLVRDLPKFDADLIILDERVTKDEPFSGEPSTISQDTLKNTKNALPPNELLYSENNSETKAKKDAVNFKNLQDAIHKFTPQEFHYTMQRIVAVLPRSAMSNHKFRLGLNLRAVIIEPRNVFELFLTVVQQLSEFLQNHQKTSLCISGGGLEGYIYSIGVISAIDRCLVDKECCDFDIFCGVSSGAIISSILAAGVGSKHLVKQIYGKHETAGPLRLNTIFDPAAGEIARRLGSFLRAFASLDLGQLITRLQQAVPTGFFRGEKLRKFLEQQIREFGFEDNLTALKKELYINATDQDTGENVIFGEEPWANVRISQAIRASTALPPFYLPERINGHWFTDGQLTSSSDFNIAIRKGAGLVVYIDPMVPYTSNLPGAVLSRGGYFTAVQAIKSLVQTRSQSMLKHSMDNNPDVDFIVFKPTDKVMEAMAGNPMKYRIRFELVDYGYRATLAQILGSYDAIAHKFAKHGFTLKSKETISSLLS